MIMLLCGIVLNLIYKIVQNLEKLIKQQKLAQNYVNRYFYQLLKHVYLHINVLNINQTRIKIYQHYVNQILRNCIHSYHLDRKSKMYFLLFKVISIIEESYFQTLLWVAQCKVGISLTSFSWLLCSSGWSGWCCCRVPGSAWAKSIVRFSCGKNLEDESRGKDQ